MSSFENRLVTASTGWVDAGVISEAQRAAILERHPLAAGGGGSRFVTILATVGGLLLAIGVSLIVKANWQALGDWVKIGGLVALMLAAYGTGGWLKSERGGYPKTGDAFFMVGTLLFLLGIALVSQIFHLDARPASGLMIWWLGIVALPWLARSKGAQLVSLVALFAWLGMEMGTEGSWIHIAARNEGGFMAVYFFLGLGVWFSGLALRGTRGAAFAGLHEMCGLWVCGGALYALGFYRHLSRWSAQGGLWQEPGALLVSAGLMLVAGLGAWRFGGRDFKGLAPWFGLAALPVIAVAAGIDLGDGGWLWSGLAWVMLFVLSVAVIRVGIETGREGWVNLGVVFIAVNIVTRYFDLFGTMLEGGVFFIVTGVLVIALGIFLEKKRRSLLVELRKGGGA